MKRSKEVICTTGSTSKYVPGIILKNYIRYNHTYMINFTTGRYTYINSAYLYGIIDKNIFSISGKDTLKTVKKTSLCIEAMFIIDMHTSCTCTQL